MKELEEKLRLSIKNNDVVERENKLAVADEDVHQKRIEFLERTINHFKVECNEKV